MSTTTATIASTIAPPTWEDVPDHLPMFTDDRPFVLALIRVDDHTGAKTVTAAARCKHSFMEAYRLHVRTQPGTYGKALLKICPHCLNYGYNHQAEAYCACIAGQTLRLEDDELARRMAWAEDAGLNRH